MTAYVRFLTILALVAWAAPGTLAQSKTIFTHFTPAHVAKALADLGVQGATTRTQQTNAGKSFDVVSFEVAGTKHIGILTACTSAKGCLGLELLTIWAEAGKNANRISLNSFNAAFSFGKAFIGPSDTLVFTRYAISDGGVTSDNLKANIANFVGGARAFEQYMTKAGKGTEANISPADGATVHVVSALSQEAQAVVMSAGQSQGLNAMTLP